MEWRRFPDPEAVAQAACTLILDQARGAIAARGRFSIVLAGGTTPQRVYALLAESEADWAHWELYIGDERCLPPDHPERNSRMVAETLTGRVAIPPGQFHPIPAELGPEAAAAAYGDIIGPALPFDLVLLGIGEDGHTASLFPGHNHPDGPLVVPVHRAPKPPPDRVSLNYPTIGSCRGLLFLVTGAGKRDAVARWRVGAEIPAARIRAQGGGWVLADVAAWEGEG